jgi:hypothetical protein
MLKFFRKIRQKLLSENRFSKYLIYAVGEIILVVIGILIALQVNNWNEQRKLENTGQKYIHEIYKELKTERTNIGSILSSLSTQYTGTEHVLSVIESENQEIKDTVQFTESFWSTTRLFIIERDLNTFDKLKSSGQSALLKNDSLSTMLDRFYKNFDIRILNFKEFPIQIRMDLRRKSFPIGNMEDFNHENESSKLSAAYLTEYLSNNEVYEHLLSILKTCEYNTIFFEDLSNEALQVINYMEENYPELKNSK